MAEEHRLSFQARRNLFSKVPVRSADHEKCAKCKKKLYFVDKKMTLGDGRNYCVGCFTCSKCDSQLTAKNSTKGLDGKLLCERCRFEVDIKQGRRVCQRCDKVLQIEDRIAEGLGNVWHYWCFKDEMTDQKETLEKAKIEKDEPQVHQEVQDDVRVQNGPVSHPPAHAKLRGEDELSHTFLSRTHLQKAGHPLLPKSKSEDGESLKRELFKAAYRVASEPEHPTVPDAPSKIVDPPPRIQGPQSQATKPPWRIPKPQESKTTDQRLTTQETQIQGQKISDPLPVESKRQLANPESEIPKLVTRKPRARDSQTPPTPIIDARKPIKVSSETAQETTERLSLTVRNEGSEATVQPLDLTAIKELLDLHISTKVIVSVVVLYLIYLDIILSLVPIYKWF